jgi:hypothetical protein
MRNLYQKLMSGGALWVLCVSAALGQESSMKALPLEDMSSFKDQAGNWFVVGDISMNPAVDVHHNPASEETKKRNKRNETPQAVTYEPGKGILLNMNSEQKKSPLITDWEHGDIDIAMEVMLPKGSNSGIYLQGRYEVQLFDSWGVKNAKFSDMGAIYRNWEKDPDRIYLGKPPLVNAAKAPGVWQTLKISFRAPRFNKAGEKIANARFVSVELNGVKIHTNLEVPLPTGGPIEKNEVPRASLMIQGDHGPVAFRNIKYQLLEDSKVMLGDIHYQVLYGRFKSLNDLADTTPNKTGAIPELTWDVADSDSVFGITYTGVINIPKNDTYEFELIFNGIARFSLDGQEVIPAEGQAEKGSITLERGTYPIEISYLRNALWRKPQLALYVKTAGTHPKALQAYNSYLPDLDTTSPIFVEPGRETRTLRAFLDFNGDSDRRLTHTIAVGSPEQIHYFFDMKAGNVVCAWRGRFIDATPMWHGRGNATCKPLGVTQFFFTGPALSILDNEESPFPEESNQDDYTGEGYEIEKVTKRPVFKYSYRNMEITDKLYPGEDDKILIRETTVKGINDNERLYFKLAEGKDISFVSDGSYLIEGQYYIKVLSPKQPAIREVSGKSELLMVMDGTPVKYSIIW